MATIVSTPCLMKFALLGMSPVANWHICSFPQPVLIGSGE